MRRSRPENEETYRDGPIVLGEYNCVVRASRDPEALLLVHSTPLTRAEAQRLADEVARTFNAGDHVVMYSSRRKFGQFHVFYKCRIVPWFTRSDGKVRKRREYVRDANGKHVLEARITFPPKPRAAATAEQLAWDGLRVGLVLHEYAHLLDWRERKTTDHGPKFTAKLDMLVAWWREREGM